MTSMLEQRSSPLMNNNQFKQHCETTKWDIVNEGKWKIVHTNELTGIFSKSCTIYTSLGENCSKGTMEYELKERVKALVDECKQILIKGGSDLFFERVNNAYKTQMLILTAILENRNISDTVTRFLGEYDQKLQQMKNIKDIDRVTTDFPSKLDMPKPQLSRKKSDPINIPRSKS